jgi:hypothetical protein
LRELQTDPLASSETVVLYTGEVRNMMADLDNPKVSHTDAGRMAYSDGVDHAPDDFPDHELLNSCAADARDAMLRSTTEYVFFHCHRESAV